jgi:hypothetical protein
MTGVTPARVLAELEAVAVTLGVTVRAEPFGSKLLEGRGGLCWVHGEPLIVMDARLGTLDRIPIVAAALARFDVGELPVAPAVRALIDAAREGHRLVEADPSPRVHEKPGLARTRPKGK